MTDMTVRHCKSSKMAVKSGLFWFSLILSIIGLNAAGEFIILSSPKSLKFSGDNTLPESVLKEVYSASLGLSVDENVNWDGLSILDPFNTPEAVVEIYIDGIEGLNMSNMAVKKYPLTIDEYDPDTYEEMRHRISQRFQENNNKVIYAPFNNLDELKEEFGVNIEKLEPIKDSEEESAFNQELEAVKGLAQSIEEGAATPDNNLDFYFLRFRSLHALADINGPRSAATQDATLLLEQALQKLSAAFSRAYAGGALVTAVCSDAAHSRRSARAAQEPPAPAADGNETALADDVDPTDNYSEDYPAIFNIMLWFGVIMVFTLVAIVHATMSMDPGRDSIIYRMTSTRMKKDN